MFIIETRKDLIYAYHRIFDLLGFAIDYASSGEEAISKLDKRAKRPDLVLLANQLPDKSGIETMKKILQKDSSMNIVYISDDKKAGKKALECGASDFIEKPFSLQGFITSFIENI